MKNTQKILCLILAVCLLLLASCQSKDTSSSSDTPASTNSVASTPDTSSADGEDTSSAPASSDTAATSSKPVSKAPEGEPASYTMEKVVLGTAVPSMRFYNGYAYYVDCASNTFKLYRSKPDGSERTLVYQGINTCEIGEGLENSLYFSGEYVTAAHGDKIMAGKIGDKSPVTISGMNFIGYEDGWIYCADKEGTSAIYRTKDGVKMESVSAQADSGILAGDTIYYNKSGTVYCVKKNFTSSPVSLRTIAEGTVSMEILYSDGAYLYIRLENKLVTMPLSGKSLKEIVWDAASKDILGVYKGYLYYMDGGNLKRIKPDGSGESVVLAKVHQAQITGSTIFYVTAPDNVQNLISTQKVFEKKLLKCSLDGTGKKELYVAKDAKMWAGAYISGSTCYLYTTGLHHSHVGNPY